LSHVTAAYAWQSSPFFDLYSAAALIITGYKKFCVWLIQKYENELLFHKVE